MTIVNLLERFGGYTLSTLLAEDAELFRMVRMVDREREEHGEMGGQGMNGGEM